MSIESCFNSFTFFSLTTFPIFLPFKYASTSISFIEIGKWAWSPPRKNASLTIQIYRNDEDPDKGGKYEIKSGDKFEVTPEF